MRRTLTLVVALACATAAQAAPFRAGQLEASQLWSRPAVAGTNAVGYMALANRGAAPDALTGASSPLAKSVEIHASSMSGGVMSMRRETRVALAPKGGAAFAPGAYHLMFMGLTRTVKAGDTIPATLTFSSGAKLKVAFSVGPGAAPAPRAIGHDMSAMPGMDMSH